MDARSDGGRRFGVVVAVGVVVDCAVPMMVMMVVGSDGVADDTNGRATLVI